MRVIKPAKVADSTLGATNVPENDEVEWDSTTTYNTGDRVMVTDPGVHRRYESLIDNNTSNFPPDNVDGDTPFWLDLGPTNRWAPFDEKIGTQVSSAVAYDFVTYSVETKPSSPAGVAYTLNVESPIGAIAFFELDGRFIDLQVETSGQGVVFAERVPLIEVISEPGWFPYFFEPIIRKREAAIFRIPRTLSADSATVKVAVEGGGGDAKIGALVIGDPIDLAFATFGVSTGILDFSRKERDEFGNAIVVRREFARTLDADFEVQRDKAPFMQRTIGELRGLPVVWEASETDTTTLVYGFTRDFDISIQFVDWATGRLEIEGLT